MKIRYWLWLIVCGWLANFLWAKPLLIVASLRDTDQIRTWHDFRIPTYGFYNQTAIAEIDDTYLALLAENAIDFEIVDNNFQIENNYYYGRIPNESKSIIPGIIIYRKGDFYLLKLEPYQSQKYFKTELRLIPLAKRSLPDRFWKSAGQKVIALNPLPYDPFIQGLVDQVSADSIASYIVRLQNFKTRLLLEDSCYAAEEWLKQQFMNWGYPVEFDSVYLELSWPDTGWDRNVIATKTGNIMPSRIYIVSGHHDCIIWPDSETARVNAPGADDNASGIAGTLEIARIFRNYNWDPTIKFCGWAGEELGHLGSEHYAARADSQDLDIQGVINMDMIGWSEDGLIECSSMHYGSFTAALSDLNEYAAQTYVPLLTIYKQIWSGGGSDEHSFYQHGYPAICNIERWFGVNPYYHKITDLFSNMTPDLYPNVIKAALATTAILGLYPNTVQNLTVRDIGDGQHLQVYWTANIEPDLAGYRVYWGRSSGVYSDSHQVITSIDTLSGLMNDSLYFIIVRAMDNNGRLSPLAIEQTGRPRSIPLPPSGVSATPLVSALRINWQRNIELDLAGYRIYRRLNQNPDYDSLNITLMIDSTYLDSSLSGANKYYYVVRAFDQGGNASPYSLEAYGRPITLDQGILVVDETRNGTNPPDSLQDRFYDYILSGYPHTDYEYDSMVHRPILADFGPYNIIVWHGDDNIELLAAPCVSDLKSYLNAGGKLWFMGWKATGDIRGNVSYPVDFQPGDFLYDCIKISHVALSAISDSFQGAFGLLGYPSVAVDPAKVPIGSWGGTMRYIESLVPFTPAESIFVMDMRNNNSPYEGAVCGLRYLGSDNKIVLFGFPFYFMDQNQAQLVAQKVMQDFGVSGIEENLTVHLIDENLLLPTCPNPVKAGVTINYQITQSGRVLLKVYNAAGRMVKVLFQGYHKAGTYSAIWGGCDDSRRLVPAGIYFCQLITEKGYATTKITLLK